jgi:hypothetical protein
MAQYLAEEHLNSEEEPDKKFSLATKRRPCKKKPRLEIKDNPGDEADSGDGDDSDFVSISSDTDTSESGDSSTDNGPLTNAEVRCA